uniref:Uncharacterized protein n=1 Tax=Anguilla anguilla TaxID=7936 RepID=A0A0E9QD03_ANGAN
MKRQRFKSFSADLSAAGLPVTSESRQSSDSRRNTCNGHLRNNEHTEEGIVQHYIHSC